MPSSVISHFHYDPASSTLRVVFVSGMVYDYQKVPEKIFIEMKKSISKGTYLNKHVKGLYQFEKVSP